MSLSSSLQVEGKKHNYSIFGFIFGWLWRSFECVDVFAEKQSVNLIKVFALSGAVSGITMIWNLKELMIKPKRNQGLLWYKGVQAFQCC